MLYKLPMAVLFTALRSVMIYGRNIHSKISSVNSTPIVLKLTLFQCLYNSHWFRVKVTLCKVLLF